MGHSGQMGGEVQGEEDSQVGGVVLWHPSRRALSALATVDDPAAAYGGERLVFERLAQMEIRRPEVELEIGFTPEADLDPLVAISRMVMRHGLSPGVTQKPRLIRLAEPIVQHTPGKKRVGVIEMPAPSGDGLHRARFRTLFRH